MKEQQINHNVVFVTVDSCAAETAQRASTPTLDKLSPMRVAESDATFTYPAHHAFFIGILPNLVGEDPQYIPGVDQIWRSGGARSSSKKILESFTEASILEHYHNHGANVQGFGGVQFFNPSLGVNTLPRMFPNFHYYGPAVYGRDYESMPRNPSSFPLGNIDRILEQIRGKSPYFLFINSPETHKPYDTPNIQVDDAYVQLIKRVSHEHATKQRHKPESLPFTAEEIERMKDAQKQALEWVDSQLAVLFANLPNDYPTLFLVMGDHGEEFGESGKFGHAHVSEQVSRVPVWAKFQG